MEPKERDRQPHQRLAQAILGKAVADAELAATWGGDASLRVEARRWLLSNSPQLRLICEAAGWNPDVVRERIKNKYGKRARGSAKTAV